MENNILQAKHMLHTYKQEHVIEYLDALKGSEKAKLLEQILSIDFEQLVRVPSNSKLEEMNQETIEPIEHYNLNQFTEIQREMYTQKGWDILRNGEVGVIVVAGGQGSRLGHDGPKGTFDIGLPSHKSLFQLQAERLVNLSSRAAASIPWYIMTSPDNHDDTIRFFQTHNYFGYPQEDCMFFQQHTMPAVNQEGKLLFSSDSRIKFVPSGNGECFSSLHKSGALVDMKRRGIAWLFYYNVDNALIRIADPVFVGFAAYHNNPIATKVIDKSDPNEKIGISCLRNKRPAVLEYNEIPDSLSQQREPQGGLSYGLGNISIHMFRYDFIEQHAQKAIPYHVALKKIDSVDAYKLERFIFDFFPLAEKMTVLKVAREEEFAPIKNKEGADSSYTARKLILNLPDLTI